MHTHKGKYGALPTEAKSVEPLVCMFAAGCLMYILSEKEDIGRHLRALSQKVKCTLLVSSFCVIPGVCPYLSARKGRVVL